MKKTAALSVITALVFSFSACVKDKRFDYSELNLRLGKEAPEFVFDENGLFCSDGVYYVFYSLCSEDDMLLTLKEDEKGRLTRVCLTLDAEKAEKGADAFSRLSLALAKIFIPELDTVKMLEETGLGEFTAGGGDGMKSHVYGFYTAVLFKCEEGACFMLTYG